MAQFLRPISNITQTNFTGGYVEIDETTASDTDFAWGANNVIAVLEVGLTAGELPATGTTTIRYRLAQTNNGVLDGTGNTVQITAALYQGTTLIATDIARTTSGAWTTYSWTPTVTGVTNWSTLRLRFTTTASGGGATVRRGGAISWAELEAPDPIRNLVSAINVTANVNSTILLEKNLSAAIDVTASVTGTQEGEKLVEGILGVTTTSAGDVTVTVNLDSIVDVITTASSDLSQDIVLSADILATNTVAALGIADNPLSAAIDVTAITADAVLENIFNAQTAIDVTATVVATVELIIPLIGDLSVTGVVNPNLTLIQDLDSGISSTVIIDAPLLVTKDLVSPIDVTVTIPTVTIDIIKNLDSLIDVTATTNLPELFLTKDLSSPIDVVVTQIAPLVLSQDLISALEVTAVADAYLVQLINSDALINIEVTTYAKLTNASEGYISGTITDNGGNPAQRTIYLYRRSDGTKIAETTSNLSTGEYQFVLPPAQIEYIVVLKDSDDPGFGEDRIKGRVVPFLIE